MSNSDAPIEWQRSAAPFGSRRDGTRTRTVGKPSKDADHILSRMKDTDMKPRHLALPALLLASCAANVFAQAASQPDGPLTRAQVKAETKEAFREGDFEVGDTGQKAYELAPNRYPKRPMPPGETRAQVKSELETARRNGDIAVGDVGDTAREIDPKAFPPQPAASSLTRAQVKQETLAAIRAGEIPVGETGETPAQVNPSRYAASAVKAPKLKKAKQQLAATSAPGH